MHHIELNKQFKHYFRFNVPLDMGMALLKGGPEHASIDIQRLNVKLGKHDSEYNPDECTYKGKPNYSMSQYIIEKYGEEAADFIKQNI